MSNLPKARAFLTLNPLTHLMTWDWWGLISGLPPPFQCSLSRASRWLFPAAVVKNPPNNLWIIAAVLAPIAVVTVIIIIITAVLCRKNKNDFKPDTVMNLPQRAKVCGGSGRRGSGGQTTEVLSPLLSALEATARAFRNIPLSPRVEEHLCINLYLNIF